MKDCKDGVAPPQSDLVPAERLRLRWNQVHPVGAGLKNMGNTCFLNSVLQCLSYTAPLANYLLSAEHPKTCFNSWFCMMCTMQNHVTEVFANPGKAIMPTRVVNALNLIAEHFCFGRQEDAHEFLSYTVRAMQQSCVGGNMLNGESQGPSLINQIFEGDMRSRVKCLNCKAKSDTFEPYLDIALDIMKAQDLTEALTQFVKPEQLDGYKCTRCMETNQSTKTHTVHRSANVLTIALKRFNLYGDKISKVVKYPEYIDMRPFMSKSRAETQMYRLYAVLVHSGYSCHQGHYYCYVKSSDRKWYKMNDSSVSVVDESSVLNEQAYMLFYIRTSKKFKEEKSSHRYSRYTTEKCSGVSNNKQQSSGKRKRCHSPDKEESHPAAKRAHTQTPAIPSMQERKKLKIRTSEKHKEEKRSHGDSGFTTEKCSGVPNTESQKSRKRKRCHSPDKEESHPAAKRPCIETPALHQQPVQERKKLEIRISEKHKEEKMSHEHTATPLKSVADSLTPNTEKHQSCHSPEKVASPPADKGPHIETPALHQQSVQERKKLIISIYQNIFLHSPPEKKQKLLAKLKHRLNELEMKSKNITATKTQT